MHFLLHDRCLPYCVMFTLFPEESDINVNYHIVIPADIFDFPTSGKQFSKLFIVNPSCILYFYIAATDIFQAHCFQVNQIR